MDGDTVSVRGVTVLTLRHGYDHDMNHLHPQLRINIVDATLP